MFRDFAPDFGNNKVSAFGETDYNTNFDNFKRPQRGVFLNVQPAISARAKNILRSKESFPTKHADREIVYESIKPMVRMMVAVGMLPMSKVGEKQFKFRRFSMVSMYCVCVFLASMANVLYIRWDSVQMNRSGEGRFEEAVIDYLFIVYLFPIVLTPIVWYETPKIVNCFNSWAQFETTYKEINDRTIPLFMGNRPLLLTISLPIVASLAMIVTHVTMVHIRIVQVVPYCFINMITYLLAGFWYVQCQVIGNVASIIADDFQRALRHVGPSSKIADYRSLWLKLCKLTRDTGESFCYSLLFICLYLFLTITLTIYGMLSQIQEGLTIKDVGLTVSALLCIGLLFIICDEAHFASSNVRVNFQKKILMVELSWMNDDAQYEINMFLRATEMNSTELSLGGFFDVNRNLFKSLLATMVTYLVVLLQFQISLPEEDDGLFNTTMPANLQTT